MSVAYTSLEATHEQSILFLLMCSLWNFKSRWRRMRTLLHLIVNSAEHQEQKHSADVVTLLHVVMAEL